MKPKHEIEDQISALRKIRNEAAYKANNIGKGLPVDDYLNAIATLNYIEGRLSALEEVIR